MVKANPHFTIQKNTVPHSENHTFVNQTNQIWSIVGENPNYIKEGADYQLLIYGDCINPDVFDDLSEDLDFYLSKAKGHFNIIIVSFEKIRIASSYFSFLPIYYATNQSVISNSWELITAYSHLEVSEQFLVETHLFNYPIGNKTLYKDIHLLDSFNKLILGVDFSFLEITKVKDWFQSNWDPKIDLKALADRFIQNIHAYFTSDKELITFTSGFDGRTILANALAQQKSVHTFSMGRLENDDVHIPMQNAHDLNIAFDAIDLADKSYADSYFHLAEKMSKSSGGRNGFLYPHFLHCSVAYEEFQTMQTGYCGSELFRALHVAGAVTSSELVAVFLQENDDELFEFLFSSKRLKFFKSELIQKVKQDVWQSILELRSTRNEYQTQNHFFYSFIFKEAFRKVFGFWTSAQFNHIKVRTPFLDFDFIRLLLQSQYAGCNNTFFTNNPLKRYKGQLLYAQILKELNSPLFAMMTGKKYKPSQLLTIHGQISIIWPYIKKRMKRRQASTNIDNLNLISLFQSSWNKIEGLLFVLENYYCLEDVKAAVDGMYPTMSEVERDMLFQISSLCKTLEHD